MARPFPERQPKILPFAGRRLLSRPVPRRARRTRCRRWGRWLPGRRRWGPLRARWPRRDGGSLGAARGRPNGGRHHWQCHVIPEDPMSLRGGCGGLPQFTEERARERLCLEAPSDAPKAGHARGFRASRVKGPLAHGPEPMNSRMVPRWSSHFQLPKAPPASHAVPTPLQPLQTIPSWDFLSCVCGAGR